MIFLLYFVNSTLQSNNNNINKDINNNIDDNDNNISEIQKYERKIQSKRHTDIPFVQP